MRSDERILALKRRAHTLAEDALSKAAAGDAEGSRVAIASFTACVHVIVLHAEANRIERIPKINGVFAT